MAYPFTRPKCTLSPVGSWGRRLGGLLALALALVAPALSAQNANLEELLQRNAAAPDTAAPTAPVEPNAVPPATEFNPGGSRGPRSIDQNFARDRRNSPDRVFFGKNYELGANEDAGDVVIIRGNTKISGRVNGDLVVVGGDLDLQGVAERDIVVIMGNVRLGPQSRALGEIVVVGGELQSSPTAQFQRNVVNVFLGGVAPWLFGAVDWVAKGLLWGRPLPHQVSFAWTVAGLFLALYLLLAALFPKPVMACSKVLDERPATAFLTGILMAVLFSPLLALLLVSVVGIIVVPFLMLGVVIALLIGKTAVFSYLGGQVTRRAGEAMRGSLLLQVLMGGVLVAALYTLPLIGFVVWGALATFAIGAVLLAASQSLWRERPEPTPIPIQPAQPISEAPMGASVPGAAPTTAAQPRPPEPQSFRRAGFWRRAIAMMLDGLLLIVFPFLLFVVFASTNRGFGRMAGVLFPILLILACFCWVAYHVVMWTWKGTTIGGLVLGIKVVRTDGRAVGFGSAMIRAMASFFSAFVFFLGFFWAGWDRNKQSWHDKIAGTVIVRVPFGA